MSTINRRTFIKGTTASSLFVLTLAGCSEKKSAPIKSAQAQGVTQGSAKPHYVMVFTSASAAANAKKLAPKPTRHLPVCSVWL